MHNLGIRKVPPEIKLEWLVTAVTASTEKNLKIMFVRRTNKLNYCIGSVLPERKLGWLVAARRDKVSTSSPP